VPGTGWKGSGWPVGDPGTKSDVTARRQVPLASKRDKNQLGPGSRLSTLCVLKLGFGGEKEFKGSVNSAERSPVFNAGRKSDCLVHNVEMKYDA